MLFRSEDQRKQAAAGGVRRLSLARLFDKDLRWVTLHTSLLMGAFVFMYQSSTFWYPTLLTQLQQKPLAFLVLLNLGGSVGSGAFGALSEKIGADVPTDETARARDCDDSAGCQSFLSPELGFTASDRRSEYIWTTLARSTW